MLLLYKLKVNSNSRGFIMYNTMLDTFITVADCGSFTKASEKLYISPTAVMKQMNTLENHFEIQLIKRTPSGISLTEAGKIIYQDAKFIIDYSKKSIASAKSSLSKKDTIFCVGTSLLNPAKPFMDLWCRISKCFPEYKLHLVPFEDNHEGILTEIGQLGEKFDFLIGVCDSKAWLNMCNMLPLGKYKKMVAVSREHRLAEKNIINIEELYGETLMMVKQGDSGVNDFLRNDLQRHHPKINIEDTPQFYDLSVFNHAAENGKVLLTIECWQDVHPGLVSIPVNWDYSIPYGLLYSLNPAEDVLNLVNTVSQLPHIRT